MSKKVIIYQMGKVASTSIKQSLKLVQGIDVFHSHHLCSSYADFLNCKKRELGWKWDITITPESIDELHSTIFNDDELFIITLIREPISRNVSSYFHNIDKIIHPKKSYKNLSPDKIKESFLKQFPHGEPIDWFDKEFNEVLGIDAFKHSFPKSEGAVRFSEGKYNVLIMRHDIEDYQKQIHIENLLGIKNFKIHRQNVGEEKEYAEIYKKFVREVSFPNEFIDNMLETKYVRHFFDRNEIEMIKNKWSHSLYDSNYDKKYYYENRELQKEIKMKKVHVGSGQHYKPGYINIEYTPDLPFKKDMVSSGMELPFKENSVDEIISYHVLEHMPRPQNSNEKKWRHNVDDFLKEAYRTLRIGGTFIAECPDFEKIISEIVTESRWEMIDHVFGLDRYKGDTHQWGYTRKSLKKLMNKHGFDNVKISDGTDYHTLTEPSLRVEAQKIGLKRINIEPTSACNLECTICSRDEIKRPNANMDFPTYRSIIDQLFNLGLMDIEIRYFLSGEPLIAGKALITMIKYAKNIGFTNTLIHTNGTLLNKYGEGILKAGIDRVSISFDGADKETYESIRLNSEFEKTVKRVNTFLSWAKDYPTEVTIQTIVPNFIDRDDYKEKMIDLLPGADEYSVRYPHNWNTLDSISGESKFTTKVSKCFPSENMSIYADGTVPICCADLNGDHIIADVTKEPLLDIWMNQLGDIRNRMASHLPIPELCDNCERYADVEESPEGTNLDQLENYISNGELGKARGIILQLIEENPNQIDLQINLGVIETIEENYNDALSIFEKILLVDPGNEIVLENIEFINQQVLTKNEMVSN